MTRTDAEILKVAREHNVGDLNLGYTINTRPGELTMQQRVDGLLNRDQLRNNVFPMMVVNRNLPEENFSFVWCSLDDSDYSRQYVNDCKRDGYEPVTESDWIINEEAWVWFRPEKWRFRWSVTKLLVNEYDEFLMYRNEEKWIKHQERNARWNEDRISARHEDPVDGAARIAHDRGVGVEVSGTAGGRQVAIKPSSRRTIS